MKLPKKSDVIQFLKAQLSSLIASATDFTVFVVLSKVMGVYVVLANMSGNISGGIVNFLINRYFVFQSATTEKANRQSWKYVVVWIGNLLLNAGGIYLMVEILDCNKIVSKVIVSLLVGFFYNYLLQKNFVFKTEEAQE